MQAGMRQADLGREVCQGLKRKKSEIEREREREREGGREREGNRERDR